MHGTLKTVFLFSLLLLGQQLFAADYLITLNDLQVTSSLKGYYVEKVINATREKSCIGFVQTGAFNKVEPAFMQPSIEAEVETCLKRSFPRTGSLLPLIIRINHFYVYELTLSSKEFSCVDLSVSFITPNDSGYVERFLAGDAFERKGLDVTGFHAENIVASLGNCFDDFFKMEQSGHLKYQRITAEELLQNPLDHPEKFAIFRNSHIPRGIFKSFYSFRDCQPDTVTSFTVKYFVPKKDTARVRASLELGDKSAKKKPYGFSDGKNLFIWAGSGYARAVRKENSLKIRLDKDDIGAGASSGMYMGAMFGLLGGLIEALATQATAAAAHGPGNCVVDFVYGHLLPVEKPGYLKPESNTILFFSRASADETPLSVIYEHDTLCTMIPGQYLQLVLPPEFREATLLLAGKGFISRNETIALRLFNTDVYVVRVRKNGEITVGSTYDEVRKTLLRGMTPENTVIRNDLGQKPPVN